MPYAILGPSGCAVVKNRPRLRLDLYLSPTDPYYQQVYVVDETSPEFLAGYKGKVDADGIPLDQADYDKWWDDLPHIWRDTPFHSHFIYIEPSATDEIVKQRITDVLTYFYGFYQACWKADKEFIEEWKKVPRIAGTIRSPIVAGKAEDLQVSQLKLDDIKSRIMDFGITATVIGGFELPTGKGTIDIGPGAVVQSYDSLTSTYVDKNNPANASGIIDTFQVYPAYADMTGIQCATCYVVSGDNLSTTDYDDTIGTAAPGGTRTFTGLSIDVTIGDYLGIYFVSGYICRTATGFGDGYWYQSGDNIPCTNTGFVAGTTRKFSIYGTGTETAAGGVSAAYYYNLFGSGRNRG